MLIINQNIFAVNYEKKEEKTRYNIDRKSNQNELERNELNHTESLN